MNNGNNNTLVLLDNIAAQDLLSKAKVWMIILVFIEIRTRRKKKNLLVVNRENEKY